MADESQVLVKLRLLGAAALARDAGKGSKALGKLGSTSSRTTAATSALGSSVNATGNHLRTLGRWAAYGGVALGAILALGAKQSVDAFAESQTVAAQTTAALKSTGGAARVTAKDISALATQVSDYSGRDDEAVQASENLLLTFTNIKRAGTGVNDIFGRATKTTADLAQTFHKDLNSSAILLGKALNDPIKGITALGRTGIQFSASQRATIKSLVDSGNLLEAQKIILGEVETQVGGAAKAYGKTLPGAIDRARTQLGNIGEVIGKVLAPIITGGANVIAAFAKRIEPSLSRAAVALNRMNLGQRIWSVLSAGISAVASVAGSIDWDTLIGGARVAFAWIAAQVPKVVSFAEGVIKRIPGIASAIGGVITQVVDALRPAMPFIRNVVLPLLKGIAIGVIGGVVAAFKIAIPIIKVIAIVLGAIGKAAAPLSGLIEKIGLVIGFVFGIPILGAIGRVAEGFSKVGGAAGLVGKAIVIAVRIALVPLKVLETIVRANITVFKLFGGHVMTVARALGEGLTWVRRYVGFLTGVPGQVGRIAVNMVGSFVNGIARMPALARGLALRAVRALGSVLGSLPGRAWTWMSGLAGGLSSGRVLTAIGNAARRIGKAVIGAIVKFIKESPGVVANAIGSVLPGPIRRLVGLGGGTDARTRTAAAGLAAIQARTSQFAHRAAGGLIPAGAMSWVGERGPELARATPLGTRVYPASQSSQMVERMASPRTAIVQNHIVLQVDRKVLHEAVFAQERALIERS